MKTENIPDVGRVRCYDNDGKTLDRYTVVLMDQPERKPDTYGAIAASEHGLGVLMYVTAQPGRHLGRRIPFDSLPIAARNYALQTNN
jgi:hypothetical protein